MFRGKGESELMLNHFSVGSIIEINGGENFLIIGTNCEVRLLNLSTFKMSNDNWIHVEDINYLTTDDVKKLIDNYQVSFSDNDYNPIGLKDLKYKNGVIK